MPKHRGRIQAQGGGTEKSVSWSQDNPLTHTDGLAMMNQLESQLSSSERLARKNSLQKARQFVHDAANNNGVDAQVIKTFKEKGTKDIRIGIEIISGKAFVWD